MNYSSLLTEIESYIRSGGGNGDPAKLPYHNIENISRVVSAVGKIAGHENLADEQYFIVLAAAWFLVAGYQSGAFQEPETESAEIASKFLTEKGVSKEIVTQVSNCILASRVPQSPKNPAEEILSDGRLFYFGADDFSDLNKSMRKEAGAAIGTKIEKDTWRAMTIGLMESHHYFTSYAKDLWDEKKRENLDKLKKKSSKDEEEAVSEPTRIITPDKPKKFELPRPESENFSSKKQKSDRPEKGIETMFRISSGNHQRLSDMADNKANIMISTNSIIISVLLSVLLRKLEDNAYLVLPTILLLAVCVTTMVFSILSTRPSVPPGTFTEEDIDKKKVNLLFFGNFYKMSYTDYASGMQAMMDDRDFLYGSLTRDIYSQGVVLGKKYRHLRIAYNVFMFGIVVSVVTFVLSSMYFGS